MNTFNSQGVFFEKVLICPHFEVDRCLCRKPQIGLVTDLLQSDQIDFARSWMIGDRNTDQQFGAALGINSILFNDDLGWKSIAQNLCKLSRQGRIKRKSNETDIEVFVDCDSKNSSKITTGIGFFDHMLEQLAKHAGIYLELKANGDLHIDEHHTVEDTAIVLGQALRRALGDKIGIARYGFLLPMDEACSEIALDLSGRSFFKYDAAINREKIGDLPVECVSHFFRSLAEHLGATLHIKTIGENAHHMIESQFKGVGQALKQAIRLESNELPSTKGIL